MSLKLQQLIDEATRLGNNVNRHVAQRLWGTVNVATINDAKRLVSSHLDGQENTTYANCPVMDIPAANYQPTTSQQAEDRIKRRDPTELLNEWDKRNSFGPRPYKVRVYSEDDGHQTVYTVTATSEIDARSIAFLLDGGCEPGLTDFDAGHVELVKEWTEVIE